MYVSAYIIGNKLHNIKCNMMRLMSEFYIITYFLFT